RPWGSPQRGDTAVGPDPVSAPPPSTARQPLEEEPRSSSLPSIPNPFPELCSPSNSPILSSPALGQGPPREGASHVVKVFGEDGACRSLEAAAGTTARQLCETLVRRTRALQDHSWALVELHQHLGLGERGAWRTTSWWWRCRALGPPALTPASSSARTSPSTSSSRAPRYVAAPTGTRAPHEDPQHLTAQP
uniref:Ras-associating domain-containing protein n=1 Tax=Amazona collaria TaxID=241587 RepID=A0A8B9FC60_9PSIT